MNRLSLDRQAQAIRSLVEGNSIRSTERMTGISRTTTSCASTARLASRLRWQRV